MKAVGNWYTTLIGTLGGILVWWSGVGFKIPETRQEWASTVGGIALALLGLSAKDGATGSPPGSDH